MERGRFGDLAIGLVFTLGGVGVVVHAAGLRSMPGTIVGSGLFPTITGALMAGFGGLLVIQSLVSRSRSAAAASSLRDRASIVYSLSVLAGLIVLTALLPALGFVIASAILTTGLARFGGAPWVGSALCGAGLTIILYAVFVHGLGVPLPRGPLG